MRLAVKNKFLKTPVYIRKDYRRKILNFIKSAVSMSNPDLFEVYYNNHKSNRPKPFTFSVSFDIQEKTEDSFVLKDHCMLYLSFLDPMWLFAVYNGILKLKSDSRMLGNFPQEIEHIFIAKDAVIKKDNIIFKTFSPILVRKINNGKGEGYLEYTDPSFLEGLKVSTVKMASAFLNTNLSVSDIEIDIIKMKSDIVENYGGEIGNSGVFKMKAPADVLKMVYDAGIGAKRSQGFGMLEVIE